MAVTSINSQDQYLVKPFGALTVQPRVSYPPQVTGANATGGGTVTGEDGVTQISQGVQAVGCGTTYAEGAGSHYTNGRGHAMHTNWFIG